MTSQIQTLLQSLGLSPVEITSLQVESNFIQCTCNLPQELRLYLSTSSIPLIETRIKNKDKFYGFNINSKGCIGFYKPKEFSTSTQNYKLVIFNNKFCSAIEKFNEI